MNDFIRPEFCRFVLVRQYVAKVTETPTDYPPMQDLASSNLEAVKKKIEAMIREHRRQ